MTCSFLQAVDYLLQGKAVAFPTDTVYGLGVSLQAHQKGELLFNLKKRDRKKPLVIYVNSIQEIESITHRPLSKKAQKLSEAFLPGPMTVIVNNNNPLFEEKLGFRIVEHPIVRALIDYVGPLLATSANTSSLPSALFATDVQEDFNDCNEALYIIPGSCTLGLESTVIDTEPIHIYREGVISKQTIENHLQQKVLSSSQKKKYANLEIYTVQDTQALTNLLNQMQFKQYFVETNPHPFRFHSVLRQALRAKVHNIIFIYNEHVSAYPILRPFLLPYLVTDL